MFRVVRCSLWFWCILEAGDRLQDDCHNDCGTDAMIFPLPRTNKFLKHDF